MLSKIYATAILLTLSFSAFGQSLSHSQGEEYTAEQKAKLNQAEELADKFVQRWHETLDFKTVFDEYFVTSPEYRKQNYYLFSKPESCKSCDEDMIRDGYFAYHNALARRQELALAYGTTDNGDCRCPLKFLGASKLLERSFEGTISPDKDDYKVWIPKYSSIENQVSQLAKEILPLSIFSSEGYQSRFKEDYDKERKAKISSSELLLKISKNVICYDVKRGVFEFYIIEENGVFKVLSMDRSE